jgi:hypothetical protein
VLDFSLTIEDKEVGSSEGRNDDEDVVMLLEEMRVLDDKINL